jgi:hypothetical protein
LALLPSSSDDSSNFSLLAKFVNYQEQARCPPQPKNDQGSEKSPAKPKTHHAKELDARFRINRIDFLEDMALSHGKPLRIPGVAIWQWPSSGAQVRGSLEVLLYA